MKEELYKLIGLMSVDQFINYLKKIDSYIDDYDFVIVKFNDGEEVETTYNNGDYFHVWGNHDFCGSVPFAFDSIGIDMDGDEIEEQINVVDLPMSKSDKVYVFKTKYSK